MWDHIVRPGESLWQISKRFNKNLNEIFRLNPQIRDKNNIWPGVVVHMPDPAPQGDVMVGPITVINDTYNGSEEPIELAPQFRSPEDNLFYRPMPNPHRGGRFQPIFDDDTKAVIGYMYASLGYYEVYDVSGQRIWSDEEPVETPLLDPIDFIFIVEGLARGIGKAALKLGIRAAASAGSKAVIREVTTAIIGTMRGAFRAVISARTLKFTATTVERMATRGRYVPVHLLKWRYVLGLVTPTRKA
jgi:LysM repeat protein